MRFGMIICLFFAIAAIADEPNSAGAWQLAWSDEFDGPAMSSPDPGKWNYDTGGGGWGNNEEEVYCAGASDAAPCDALHPNSYLDGAGHLIIRAIDNHGTWTSARLQTAGKATMQYGRIEARMKLPQGAGVWPAFWMLGDDVHTAGWPKCGEIDIMENVPMLGARTIASTIHGPKSRGTGVGGRFTFETAKQVDTDFHTYGVIRSPGKAQFYVDDYEKPFFAVSKASDLEGDWVYDHSFFILLNLAIGGDWPGPSNQTTPRPAVMMVDYVRAYKDARLQIK